MLLAKDWKDWLTKEGEQRTLLSYPQLSHKEIDELIDTGLKEFYLRPKQIWSMFITMRTVGDLLRKIHGFKAFVHYFAQKIARKIKQSTPEKPKTVFINRIAKHDAKSEPVAALNN